MKDPVPKDKVVLRNMTHEVNPIRTQVYTHTHTEGGEINT